MCQPITSDLDRDTRQMPIQVSNTILCVPDQFASQSDAPRICQTPIILSLAKMSIMQKFAAAVLVYALAGSTLPAASAQNRAYVLPDLSRTCLRA